MTAGEFDGWSDEQLRDYEQSLYDDEVRGEDVWHQRDRVLWEMNRRGMMDRRAGVQPDPAAAKLVSDVAVLLDRYGDAFFDEGAP